MEKGYTDFTVENVKEFMRTTRDDTYQLVDVRQPDEYAEEHLAGAIHIPVGEIETRSNELDLTKDVIFYCLSGRRSAAAAVFASSSGVYSGSIYNMTGGIAEWDEDVVLTMPNLQVFNLEGTEQEILHQAMNLEKGAHRFYQLVLDKFPDAPFTPVMEELVKAEEVHAKMVYAFWAKLQNTPQPFEELYASLRGDILEGGLTFDTLADKVLTTEVTCEDVIEMAIAIEFSAYDLYRNMAHKYNNTPMHKPFITLCQSEKDHMRIAAEALCKCLW